MNKISRRSFIGKYSVINTSLIFGTYYWLSACEKDSIWRSGLEYLPIQNDNPAIARWPRKCEDCGDCIEACAEKQKVFGNYQANATKHVCIHCGTCIKECEERALTEKYHWRDVLEAIDNPSKIVIASISPSVRVGIGDYFGMTTGSIILENMVGACREVGFDYVLDTNFSADLTIMEEASGAGIIFGNTGGVMTAALRTTYFNITGTNPPGNFLELQEIQSLSGFKEAKITIGSTTLNVAVCYEMRNAKILLDQVINGSCKYDFIEVMACKGGCVGGAGQPAGSSKIEERITALKTADSQASFHFSHENAEIKAIYRDFLGEVGGETAKKYLHTTYNNKSDLLLSI